jgi:hypothetical protein
VGGIIFLDEPITLRLLIAARSNYHAPVIVGNQQSTNA